MICSTFLTTKVSKSKPSKLKPAIRVPTTLSTVTLVRMDGPAPAATKHRTDVDDAHAAVSQLVNPMAVDGVTFSAPKLSPAIVTLRPAVIAAFGATKLTTGAARGNCLLPVVLVDRPLVHVAVQISVQIASNPPAAVLRWLFCPIKQF